MCSQGRQRESLCVALRFDDRSSLCRLDLITSLIFFGVGVGIEILIGISDKAFLRLF
jgi:hypothetical protein